VAALADLLRVSRELEKNPVRYSPILAGLDRAPLLSVG
jgi:hypothetical protein